jgi:hypothetical protein
MDEPPKRAAADPAAITAALATLTSGPADFCADWPDEKKALILIAAFVKPIKPEVAKWLGEVITWGDRAYALCSSKPVPPPGP